jgi:hypothetical protein
MLGMSGRAVITTIKDRQFPRALAGTRPGQNAM